MSLFLTEADYETARENGISPEEADDRFYNLGWSRNRSIYPVNYVPEEGRGKRGRFMSAERREWLKVALKNHITEKAFLRRLYKGVPIEIAATRPMDIGKMNKKYRERMMKDGYTQKKETTSCS